MELNFVSLSGHTLWLPIDDTAAPATIYPKICKQLNLPISPLLFYRNGRIISYNTKFSELKLNKNDKIIFKNRETRVRIPQRFQLVPEIDLLTNTISESLSNTNQTKPKIYERYLNTQKKEFDMAKKDPENMRELIDEMISMGFDEESATQSLRKCRYNIQNAVNDLLNKSEQHSTEELVFHFPGIILKRLTSNVQPPSKDSPYHRHFDMERFTCTEDSGYTPQLESNARREVERAQHDIEQDLNEFEEAMLTQTRKLANESDEHKKQEISQRLTMIQERHASKSEMLHKALTRAEDRLRRVLEAKAEAHIEDIPVPASPPRYTSVIDEPYVDDEYDQTEEEDTVEMSQQRPRENELDMLLSDITPEEQERLQSLITDSVSFSEVVQFYLLNDRNFEATQSMLA